MRNAVDEFSTADKEFVLERPTQNLYWMAAARRKERIPQRLALGTEVFGITFGEHERDPPMLDFEAVISCSLFRV